ncbi:MAG: hypothetical protein ACO2Y0_01660 [Nitrosopumilaceae archaeon]
MDKYLMIIMIFLVVTMPISFIDIGTGEIKENPRLDLFYGAIAGLFIIIVYGSYKDRKARQRANAKRRGKK